MVPRIVVELVGGVIQDISSDLPVKILVIDYDYVDVGRVPEIGFPVSYDYKRVSLLFDDPLCERKQQ